MTRRSQREFRAALQFVQDRLESEKNPEVGARILELLLAAGRSNPNSLADIVSEYDATKNSALTEVQICYALGGLVTWPHSPAKAALEKAALSFDADTRIHAALAKFKIFVRTEGLNRTNNRSLTGNHGELSTIFTGFLGFERLLVLLTSLSHFLSPQVSFFLDLFRNDYDQLRLDIRDTCKRILPKNIFSEISETLKSLIEHHDFIGISLLMIDTLKKLDMVRERRWLIHYATTGDLIQVSNSAGSKRNLVACYARAGQYDAAKAWAKSLSAQYPESPMMQLLFAHVLVEEGIDLAVAMTRLRETEELYNLDAESIELAKMLREKIADLTFRKNDGN